MKLPKQWPDWCRHARLRPMGRCTWRNQYRYFYLVGRGRVWRVNDRGAFQCGDTYADFDRWALCDIREVPTIPTTRDEFVRTVHALLKEHANA